MTIDRLASDLEIAYWADNRLRVSAGAVISETETIAARAHLPELCRFTAKAGARWARRARRPLKHDKAHIRDSVANEAQCLIDADPKCSILVETIGFFLLRSLLENLAWRFAVWLFSDATEEDRPDLICRMEAE